MLEPSLINFSASTNKALRSLDKSDKGIPLEGF